MVAGVVALLAASQIAFAANGAPTTYGDIYRVAASGAVTNLTHDPAAEIAPVASPDGKRIAFVRLGATQAQLVVMNSDGTVVHAVSPRLGDATIYAGGLNSIAWSPDGRRLAVAVSGRNVGATSLYVTSVTGGWRHVDSGVNGLAPVWSADGHRLAVTTASGLIDVVDANSGKRLWRAAGEGASAWSRSGRLAVHANTTMIGIYNGAGRMLATYRGDVFAWSGDRLASLRAGNLELRVGGVGAPQLRTHVVPGSLDYDAGIAWGGATRLYVRGRTGVWRTYDVARHRLLADKSPWDTVFSAAGVPAHVDFGSPTVALVRGTTNVRVVPTCSDDDPFNGVQFLGRTNALIYQSSCPLPSGEIYTVAPDGTGLRQVTDTPTDEFDPALGPNGLLAWSEQLVADRCKGCPHNLWVASASQLTMHSDDERAPFDDNPTFSPDGKTLAFVRSGADSQPTLETIAAGGGAATSLGAEIGVARYPAWGARGIAFVADGLPPQIRLVDPATRAVMTLAVLAKGHDAGSLAWSPDGRLAYLTYDGTGSASIAVVGGGTIRLVQHRVTGLAWSPDGTRLAYVADDANGYGEVWTIGVDGTGVQQVTRNLGVVGTLSWR